MKSKIIVGNQKMLMGYKDVKNFVDNFKYKKDVINHTFVFSLYTSSLL